MRRKKEERLWRHAYETETQMKKYLRQDINN
jgi:hypothetical protein